mgnify:CR=1 FL=1
MYRQLQASIIIEHDRHDFRVKLWDDHPLEHRVIDAKSRELLVCSAGLYGLSIERTIPPSFRVIRDEADTIHMAEQDLEAWTDRALEELKKLISLEFGKDARARIIRDRRWGSSTVAECRAKFQQQLRDEGWMVVPWVGDLCGDHWRSCLPLLQKKYGDKRGGETYDQAISASRDVPVDHMIHTYSFDTHCACWILTGAAGACARAVAVSFGARKS